MESSCQIEEIGRLKHRGVPVFALNSALAFPPNTGRVRFPVGVERGPAIGDVVVLDPEAQIAHVFSDDEPPRTLRPDEELILSTVLDDFRVRVGQFFRIGSSSCGADVPLPTRWECDGLNDE
jgi:hypothetical protein